MTNRKCKQRSVPKQKDTGASAALCTTYPEESQMPQGHSMTKAGLWPAHMSREPPTSHGGRQLSHLGTAPAPRQDFSDCSFQMTSWLHPFLGAPAPELKLRCSWIPDPQKLYERIMLTIVLYSGFLFVCFRLRIIFTIAVTSGSAEHCFSDQDFYFRTIFLEQFYIYNKNENLLFL